MLAASESFDSCFSMICVCNAYRDSFYALVFQKLIQCLIYLSAILRNKSLSSLWNEIKETCYFTVFI